MIKKEQKMDTEKLCETCKWVAVKQADRKASGILKIRSNKPKQFGIPVF